MIKVKKTFNILVILILIILCCTFATKTFQNDTFYTIKIGESITKYGVDMLDHFSFHNIAYTYPHWLYDLFIYTIYNLSGFTGLYVLNVIFYLFLGLSLYFLNNKLYKNNFVSAVFSIFSVICIADFVATRAQLVTYILFIYELFFIEKFLNSEKKKFLIPIPIISILIVNLHCAVWPFFFVLFLPSIVEKIIYLYKNKEIKFKRIHKESGKFLPCKSKINIFNKRIDISSSGKIKWLVFVMILCIFTGFITLNGTTPFTYIIKTMQGNTTSWIGEHQPSVLKYNVSQIIILVAFVISLSFFKVKYRLRDLFLIIGSLILSFMSTRHIVLLIICSCFVFNKVFSDYLNNIDDNLSNLFIKVITRKIIMPFMLILFVLLGVSNYYQKKIYDSDYVDSMLYPVKASDYILENLDLNSIRLFNEYNYGSYLLFRGIPVFIDSRADLYTIPFSGLDRDITDDFLNIEYDYEEIFDYYSITHVMTYRHSMEDKDYIFYKILDLDKNYKVIYEDEYFAIFERNENN